MQKEKRRANMERNTQTHLLHEYYVHSNILYKQQGGSEFLPSFFHPSCTYCPKQI